LRPRARGKIGDAVPEVFDGAADSATQPTPMGTLSGTVSGSFSSSAKHLAWTFVASAGSVVRITAGGAGLDTVLSVYRASPSGAPSGAALASNDDCDAGTLESCLELSIAQTSTYVAVVRRYDRGGSGTATVTLEGAGGASSGLVETFERPEVGLLVDAAGRRCTARW
jgi:hypothetical protein